MIEDAYHQWVAEHDTINDADRASIRQQVERLTRRPLLSVLMPAYNTPERLLREAVASVRAQLYPFWELCIVDDASPDTRVRTVATELAAEDSRIRFQRRWINGNISMATNNALAMAGGEFVALMDHDDILPEHALFEVALEIIGHPDVDVMFSDEDRIDDRGRRSGVYFKPMWSAELLAGHNMISHLGVYRTSLVKEIGGMRIGFEGSQDWDLAIRATAATTPDRIRHIPSVLYHWRKSAENDSFSDSQLAKCIDAGRRAVDDWLRATAPGARVESARLEPGWSRVAWPGAETTPMVSVVVALHASASLHGVIDALFTATAWPCERLELVVGYASADAAALRAILTEVHPLASVRTVEVPGSFNSVRLMNAAAAAAGGDIVVFGHCSLAAEEPGWLEELTSVVLRPHVGAVGSKLLDRHGRIYHAGYALGPGNEVGHQFKGFPGNVVGPMGHLALSRAASAVSLYGMGMRRALFSEVGMLDETLLVGLCDVDLCLRLSELGYTTVWSPDVVLGIDADALSFDGDITPGARSGFHARWASRFADDPFHNPNTILSRPGGPVIPARPRRIKPWRAVARHSQVSP